MTSQNKPLCGAKLRNGEGTCTREAGWGTPHVGFGACKLHGGSVPTHVKKWEQAVAEKAAKDAAKALNLTDLPNVPPEQALFGEVNRCQQVVNFISEQIEQLEYDKVAGLMVTKVTDATGVERTVSANVWVKLLGEWSDRLTRTSKVVLDAGIAERLAQIQEQQAAAFARVLYGILEDLGIDTGPETVSIVKRHMTALDTMESSPSLKAI